MKTEGMICKDCEGTGLFFQGSYIFGEVQEPEPCEKCQGMGKIKKYDSLFKNEEHLLGGW